MSLLPLDRAKCRQKFYDWKRACRARPSLSRWIFSMEPIRSSKFAEQCLWRKLEQAYRQGYEAALQNNPPSNGIR